MKVLSESLFFCLKGFFLISKGMLGILYQELKGFQLQVKKFVILDFIVLLLVKCVYFFKLLKILGLINIFWVLGLGVNLRNELVIMWCFVGRKYFNNCGVGRKIVYFRNLLVIIIEFVLFVWEGDLYILFYFVFNFYINLQKLRLRGLIICIFRKVLGGIQIYMFFLLLV